MDDYANNWNKNVYILWVFDKEFCNEIFGQIAGVAEEFLFKCIIDGWHVGQGLLLIVTQKRRCTTQTRKNNN